MLENTEACVNVPRRDPVRAREDHPGRRAGHDRPRRRVRADVLHVVERRGEERPVRVEGEPGLAVLVPCRARGLQVLPAVLDPLERDGHLARREQHADVLAQRHDLLPEAAADVAGDHPHAVLGDAEQPGGEHPHLVRCLRGRPHGQLAAAPRPFRDQPAGLHRDGALRLLPDRLADHVRGAVVGVGDGLGGRAGEFARQVAGVALVHERFRRPGGRVVGDRGQRLVVHVDQLGGVLREVAAVRHDEGHDVAGEPRLAVRRAAAAACPGPGSPSRCTRPRPRRRSGRQP